MRTPLTACLAAAFLAAATVHAAPASASATASASAPASASATAGPDRSTLAAFETGFKEGQDLMDQGQHSAAARRWKAAADLLPETTANREMRAGIYEYIADAYTRAVSDDTSLELVREASTAFDQYIAGYTRAYGTETPPNPKLAATQKDLADRRARAEAAAGPKPIDGQDAPGPEPAPTTDPTPTTPTTRPWKPLVITGSVLVGVGAFTLFAGAYSSFRSGRLNREYNRDCPLNDPSEDCQSLFQRGKDANSYATAGFVFTAVLLAVGVPLLAVGMKRKKAAANQAFLPVLGPTQVGLNYTLRF
jgi:hypothetical protein